MCKHVITRDCIPPVCLKWCSCESKGQSVAVTESKPSEFRALIFLGRAGRMGFDTLMTLKTLMRA